MVSALFGRRYTLLGIAFAATAASAVCWRQLELADYFLVRTGLGQTVRNESAGSSSAQVLQHFRWRVPEALTWGALRASPGLGLEAELVVESYKCSKNDGRTLDFGEISGRPIAAGELITVVLRRGACPR